MANPYVQTDDAVCHRDIIFVRRIYKYIYMYLCVYIYI